MLAGCGTGLPGVCPCGGLSTAKIVQVGGWGKSFYRCRGRCLSVREFIFGKDNENRVQTKPVRSRRSAFLPQDGSAARSGRSNGVRDPLAYNLLIGGLNINCLCSKNKTYRTNLKPNQFSL